MFWFSSFMTIKATRSSFRFFRMVRWEEGDDVSIRGIGLVLLRAMEL
jgi:hypothetical protein